MPQPPGRPWRYRNIIGPSPPGVRLFNTITRSIHSNPAHVFVKRISRQAIDHALKYS